MSSIPISGQPQGHGYYRPLRRRGSPASSHQVRRKFFQKIGVGEYPGSNHRPQSVPVSRPSTRDVRLMPRFKEPLRYERREEEMEQEEGFRCRQSASPTSVDARELTSAGQAGATKPKKGVRFQETVTVVRIPNRSQYSDRIRATLYSDAVEMCENAERNLVEFTAENGDWRRVTLEEEMYICAITGELIHPAHIKSNKYVFGSGAGSQQSLSQEREKYWNDEVAI